MSIQLYKKANAQASPEKDSKDPSIQKWNGGAVCVKIGNEYIPVSELAKLAKAKNSKGFVAIEKVENEMEIDGETHDMDALINLYQSSRQNMTDKDDPALQAAIKGMKKYDSKGNEIAGAVEDNQDENSEDAAGKKNEDDGQKELEKDEKEGREKTVVEKGNKKEKDNASDEGMVKDTGKNQAKKEDEDTKKNEDEEDEEVKESIRKQSRDNGKGGDVRHFIRLNTARENGSADAGVLTIDTMHNRVDRGKSRYGRTAK